MTRKHVEESGNGLIGEPVSARPGYVPSIEVAILHGMPRIARVSRDLGSIGDRRGRRI